jgi:UDP-N-acetylmuramoylalanine--D-glutamate ligase
MREKSIAVLGLARAGIPAARFLASRGESVRGYDARPRAELSDEALALESLGVELRVGDALFPGLAECSHIILSPGLKIHHEPLASLLRDCEEQGAEIIGELELAARHCPAPMIAVTGTKGKSTTTGLIYEMLRAAGVNAVRAGNSGTPLIAELAALSPRAWAVVEVSSFQLEKAPTFKPRIAALLNLLPDHQDYHTSLEQYWDTKWKLFARQDERDTAIFNADDERLAAMRGAKTSELHAQQLTTTSREAGNSPGPYVCAHEGVLGFPGLAGFEPVIALDEIPLRGAHNWSNVAVALAAVESALSMTGEDFDEHRDAIIEAIRNFQSLPHRLEPVGTVNGVQFVNDSQATIPDAAIRAVEAFAPPVILICGGLDKLNDPHGYDALGEVVARRAHCLITIGQASPLIEAAARRAGMDEARIVSAENLTNAVRSAIMHAPEGGTVVLSPACASFDQFQSYEHRGQAFRDAVAALEQVSESASHESSPAFVSSPPSPLPGVAR